MTDDLEAAARAFRRTEKTLDERRRALAAAIVEAAAAGVKQAEIVRITGYTREYVRQLVKAAEQQE